MDFVTAWKAVSVGLTALFGLLGLLTEFKDKVTSRITVWGKISLLGILISGILGVAAQLKESSDQEISRQATVHETLSLVQKTDRTVRDLQRILSPLDELQFMFGSEVPCGNSKYEAFCSGISKLEPYKAASPSDWEKWPGGITVFILDLDFFTNENDAQLFRTKDATPADLYISFVAGPRDKTLWAWRVEDEATIVIRGQSPPSSGAQDSLELTTNGKIKSVLDLPGTTMFLTLKIVGENIPRLDELRLDNFKMWVKNNQVIAIDIDHFQRVTVAGTPAYRYVFPRQSG